MAIAPKTANRNRRHKRIRARVKGTEARPRLAVFRSNKFLYAQIINDDAGTTLVNATSMTGKGKGKEKKSSKEKGMALAVKVGKEIATKAKAKGVSKVVFDRGGFIYTGHIKAFADAAREGGLEF